MLQRSIAVLPQYTAALSYQLACLLCFAELQPSLLQLSFLAAQHRRPTLLCRNDALLALAILPVSFARMAHRAQRLQVAKAAQTPALMHSHNVICLPCPPCKQTKLRSHACRSVKLDCQIYSDMMAYHMHTESICKDWVLYGCQRAPRPNTQPLWAQEQPVVSQSSQVCTHQLARAARAAPPPRASAAWHPSAALPPEWSPCAVLASGHAGGTAAQQCPGGIGRRRRGRGRPPCAAAAPR